MKTFAKAVVLLLLFIKAQGGGLRGCCSRELNHHDDDNVQDIALVVEEPGAETKDQQDRNVSSSHHQRTVVIIRVITAAGSAPTVSSSDLYQAVFSDEVSLKHHLSKCSAGQVQLEPTSYGILDVHLDTNRFTSRRDMMDAAVQGAAIYTSSTSILHDDDVDHILIVLPQGVPTNSTSWAEIGPGAKFSIFQDTWALSLSSLMHEVSNLLCFIVIFKHIFSHFTALFWYRTVCTQSRPISRQLEW